MSKKLLLSGGVGVLILVVGGLFLFHNQSRTLQEADLETQQPAAANAEPKTEIRTKGFNAELLITPSVDGVISGIVTIAVTKWPPETNVALFIINAPGESPETTGANLGFDADKSDGWSKILDTTKYANGLYEISGVVALDGDSEPLGIASAQVIIQN